MGKKTLLSFDGIILTTKVFIFQELHLCFHIIDLCFKYPCYCIFHPTWLPPDNSIPLSYRLNDETVFGGNVDQSNTDFTDAITGRMDFFFKTVPRPLFTPSDESSLVPHEDADFLTRCEGHDSQIIWLKQRRRFYCDPCAFQSSVTMWSAARQLERRKKAIFIDQN